MDRLSRSSLIGIITSYTNLAPAALPESKPSLAQSTENIIYYRLTEGTFKIGWLTQ